MIRGHRGIRGLWFGLLLLIAVSLLAWIPETPAGAPSWYELDNGKVRLLFDEKQEQFARHLADEFPRAVEGIRSNIGWELRGKPTVLLIGDRATFESMAGAEPIAAFAEPDKRRIVINLEAFQSSLTALNDAFKHEICHLVLHERIRTVELPKWLDEGVCQWVSGSLGEFLEGRDLSAVRVAIKRSPIPLRWLEKRFPDRDARSMFQAYEESRLFVEFLAARYGQPGLVSILGNLEAGRPIEEAVRAGTSSTLETLEKEWLDNLDSGTVWLVWFAQYLYEILFILAALLTVAAFIRQWLRKRRWKDEDEDGEEERTRH